MNMDSVKNADYKGILNKVTAFVRRMNDAYDDYQNDVWKSYGTFFLGALIVAVTSGLLAWTLVAAVVGFRFWGTLGR